MQQKKHEEQEESDEWFIGKGELYLDMWSEQFRQGQTT
jgi:hypothetical protein